MTTRLLDFLYKYNSYVYMQKGVTDPENSRCNFLNNAHLQILRYDD